MKASLLAILLSVTPTLLAQVIEDSTKRENIFNPHLWNTLIITSIQNPALTGQDHKHQIYFDYDRPWYNNWDLTEIPQNFRIGHDHTIATIKDKFRIGIGMYYSGMLQTYSKKHSIGILKSFSVKFKNESVLSVGVSFLAISFKSINFANIRFGSQFDPYSGGFNPSLTSLEAVSDDRLTKYGPLSFGIWYQARNFFIGTSSINLTVPSESFYEDGSAARSPITSYTNAGYHFNIKEKIIITPSLQYRTETMLNGNVWFHSVEPQLTFSFNKNRFIAGTYYENNAVYLLLGVDLFHHHWMTSFDGGWFVNDELDAGYQGFKLNTRVSF